MEKLLGVEFAKQHTGMPKRIINIWKITIKTLYSAYIESSYIVYLDANNLYGWTMSQKLPVNDFKWVKQERLSKFNEDFINKYDENGNIGHFLLWILIIRKNYSIFIKICHFCLKLKK